MSANGSADLLDSGRGIVASQSCNSTGSSVFPPFSEKLSADKKLKLSNENFKQTIYDDFRHRNISPLSQITTTPHFPTPHVLAQFANKTYTDYKTGETDAQYEKRLALPDGWKLLTTASNSSKTNGYFGAAYWHPKHQQVVIAHRGTVPTNLGALWTDVFGVMFKFHVPQMSSASTFSSKIVEVLQMFRREKKVSFQLLFTGHSLGGWLAQITTFTTKYLNRKENTFLKSDNVPQSYHPHTVVFDSPGCKDMLLLMTDELDVRLDGRFTELEHLDITSYLSAPNIINTCKLHLGTVYRIFIDLSDMSWSEKSTPKYNLATHSMDKILHAFDPQTGQVHRDENGQLKVQLVIDWPICVGLIVGKEHTSFFEWAKHYNNYHPDIRNEIFHLEGYIKIRYQTKLYDERVNKISVFCQQEREFLERYRWLRQLPGLFKPKELFSAMEKKRAQEQVEKAVKILKNFDIENDIISCTDASALQALIPYVKRLLQLFPEIKEETKHALSPGGVRNSVYLFETKRYVERISESPLEFNSDDSRLRKFLESEQQKVLSLQMVKGDEWTGLIKVHQVLQRNTCLIKGQYSILKLKRLLKVNQLMDLSKLMQSTVTTHLLLIACDDNQQLDKETKDVIRTLFEAIKQKQNIKIIFITRSEGSIVAFLHHMGRNISREAFVRIVEELTWSDLTSSSQKKLLEKSVKFQGSKIFLNQLMSAPVANFLPFGALLEGKELKIADPVPTSNAYNESYYIGRTLCCQKAIKQEIYSDANVKQKNVFLASTEQQYKELCQLYPNSSVHWLEDKSGKLLWQQSQGSLETLRKHIDTYSSHTLTDDNLDKLLEQAERQRVMLISGTAGMGKSTILTHLSKQIKQKFPAKWVVRINLNDHTDSLKALKQEQMNKDKAIDFVLKNLVNLKPGLEVKLFKLCCKQKQKVRVVIMLDGFDEISPVYQQTVIDLLQAIRQTAIEQLWVTTRPHLREELEDRLQQLSYTLEPFSEENVVLFLTNFWSLNVRFTEPEDKEKEREKSKLKQYAEHLIKEPADLISDEVKLFTSIPLQTHMLAEALDNKVNKFYQSENSMPELPSKLELFELYGRFIERKYDIYQKEKFQGRVNNVIVMEQRKRDLKIMGEDHQLLALRVLFTDEHVNQEHVKQFQNNKKGVFSIEELTRMGIAQTNFKHEAHFIHHTFTHYYVASYVVNSLNEWNNTSEQVQTFLLKLILIKEEYRVIRIFIESLLPMTNLSKKVLKEYGNRIHDLGKDGVKILHQVAREGNVNIVGFLLDSVLEAECTDTDNGLLQAQDEYRRTAWHMAALASNLRVLEKLWKYAEKTPKRDELNTLLATDIMGKNAWHVAAKVGNLQVLEMLWKCATKNLTEEEKINFLLATDTKGKTVYHMAAMMGKVDLLQKIWDWAGENSEKLKIKRKLLLAKDCNGMTAWHVAAKWGNLELLQKIWEWAKENLQEEEITSKLLLATEKAKLTAWQVAALEGELDILKKLWEWAETKEIQNKLLAVDNVGRAAWIRAVERGELELLPKLWVRTTRKLSREQTSNKMLLATDKKAMAACYLVGDLRKDPLLEVLEHTLEQLTAGNIKNGFFWPTNSRKMTEWHEAAELGHLKLLQKMWEWAKRNLKADEIIKLLLATDNMGRTICHMAATWHNLDLLQEVWEWAKENDTTKRMNSTLLLARDSREMTAWHMAAELGNLELLQKIWEWAKKNLQVKEIVDQFLLATDNMGRTVCHMAATWHKLDLLQEVWEWAKENDTSRMNNILLARDSREMTAWHVAADLDNLEMLQKVWGWAKENLKTEEINEKLLLATDNMGRTICHMAARGGNLKALHKVWEWVKENDTSEKMNNTLLLTTDSRQRTLCHMAARWNNLDLLKTLWKWSKEKVTSNEIHNILLLSTDSYGMTALHLAAKWSKLDLLQKIWEWAKEKLKKEEINNKLLLATDSRGRTAWHVAAEFGNQELLQKLWEWAKQELTTQDVNDKLLLATDIMGRNIMHVAAKHCHLHILQKLWEWAKENDKKEEMNDTLSSVTDHMEQTVSYREAERDKRELLEVIVELEEMKATLEEINKNCRYRQTMREWQPGSWQQRSESE